MYGIQYHISHSNKVTNQKARQIFVRICEKIVREIPDIQMQLLHAVSMFW